MFFLPPTLHLGKTKENSMPKKRKGKFLGGDLSASVTRAQKAAADARAVPAAGKPGKGTIGKSYTDMFGRTIGSKDRKQVNLQNTKQRVNEDGTLTRDFYDYDNNFIASKTIESAGAAQKAARDAGFTGDPEVAGREYREMKRNQAIFAAHDARKAQQAVGEKPPKPRRTLTAAQKAALSSDVYAKKGGKIKKKAGGSVKKKRAKTVNSKYTTGNKRYSNGGKIYPR